MRRWLPLVLLLFLLPGCLYVHVQTPLDEDLDHTTLGDKVGRSDSHSVLFLVAWGDAGTQAAARDGQLKTIHHADLEIFTILFGLYGRRTTIVYGE